MRPFWSTIFIVLFLFSGLTGCKAPWNKNGTEKGIASWYGPGYNGHTTASGETFNQNAMTAAHRSYPFGTWVRVTNLHNGRQTTVRINDRGPFIHARIIDLSHAAAQELGMLSDGITPVKIHVIKWGHS